MKVIHIIATGSHHLRRKLNTHASEEIRFYLCQRKFVDNIDPHVLYNSETLKLLWEVLWECLEARKTNELTVLERLNYRSKVIMWNWREVVDEAEMRGEGVEMTTEELMRDTRKGSLDHKAHEQFQQSTRRTGAVIRVKLKRSKKHRKMFPGFYRGELMAPSAHSIATHNQLIRKLLGKDRAKSVLQTRKHDGTTVQTTLFSSSEDSDQVEEKSDSSSVSSSSEEEDNEHGSRRMAGKIKRQQSARGTTRVSSANFNRRQMADDDQENSSDEEYDTSIRRQDTMKGRSSFGEPKLRQSVLRVRRLSSVARSLQGFGKAMFPMQ
jgi:hypothetical protein